ncbi:hypothetical protein GCM10010440_59550 [Kitasatospora cinereorecta]
MPETEYTLILVPAAEVPEILALVVFVEESGQDVGDGRTAALECVESLAHGPADAGVGVAGQCGEHVQCLRVGVGVSRPVQCPRHLDAHLRVGVRAEGKPHLLDPRVVEFGQPAQHREHRRVRLLDDPRKEDVQRPSLERAHPREDRTVADGNEPHDARSEQPA